MFVTIMNIVSLAGQSLGALAVGQANTQLEALLVVAITHPLPRVRSQAPLPLPPPPLTHHRQSII